MDELFCPHCKSKDLHPFLNGEYRCRHCLRIIGADQMREMIACLRREMEENEKLLQPGVCGRCGNKITDPHWCSWCGSEPARADTVPQEIAKLKEQIGAIERRIEAGEPAEYRQARAGDVQAVSRVFERAIASRAEWKYLIDLGVAASPFLIGIVESGNGRERSAAIEALFQLDDIGAAEPIIKTIAQEEPPKCHEILTRLKPDWLASTPCTFSVLLKKLNELSSSGLKQKVALEQSLEAIIVSKLVEILECPDSLIPEEDLRAAAALPDILVRLVKVDPSKSFMDEDAWGYLGSRHPEYDAVETLDCSSLREAARREIDRRATG